MTKTHILKARLAMLNHRGFTLVEVLIALLVLGIIFVPVSNAFLQSVHLNQHLQQRVKSVREAQAAMEVTLSLLSELEIADPTEEEILSLFANFDTSDLIETDTTVDIAPLHEDSPFLIITSTSSYDTKDTTNNFTLTALHLPGETPWLTPKEYRVVTP